MRWELGLPAGFGEHVRDLINANVVVVASANNQNGNFCDGQTPARMGYGGVYDPNDMYPTWPFVITVGGTDINDARYFCSSCPSAERGSNYGPCVDIYAPGKNVRLAHVASSTAYRDDLYWINSYNSQHPGVNYTQEWVTTGTSFAAPVVTGVVARLLQTFPSMSVRQVWNFLHDNSTALPANFDGDGKADNDRLVYISPYN